MPDEALAAGIGSRDFAIETILALGKNTIVAAVFDGIVIVLLALHFFRSFFDNCGKKLEVKDAPRGAQVVYLVGTVETLQNDDMHG